MGRGNTPFFFRTWRWSLTTESGLSGKEWANRLRRRSSPCSITRGAKRWLSDSSRGPATGWCIREETDYDFESAGSAKIGELAASAVGRDALRLPHLSCARKASPVRNPLSAEQARSAGKGGPGALQPSAHLARLDGSAGAGSSVAPPASDDHAHRQ